MLLTRLEMLDRIGTLEPDVRREELLLLMDFYRANSLGELSDAQVYEYMKLKEGSKTND